MSRLTTRRRVAGSRRRVTCCSIACQGGDYAVATLLATQYGLAALTPLGDESGEKTSTLRGEGDVERQGAGWARVKAFREGVIDGAESCMKYEDK